MTAPQPEQPRKSLNAAVATDDATEVTRCVDCLGEQEAARAISRLSTAEQSQLFGLLEPKRAAELLEGLSEEQAAPILGDLPPAAAAAIVDHLPSDEQADLIGRLGPQGAEQVLRAMAPAGATDARRLLQYAKETAGGLMVTEYLAYPEEATAEEVVDDLRRNAPKYRA